MGAKELSLAHQELFDAVRKGDSQKVRTWLASRKNKRPRTPLNFLRSSATNLAWLSDIIDPSNGYTALHLASLLGHKEIIRLLLNVDLQLARTKDRRGCLPIHLAAWNGHVDAVQVLIDAEPSSVDAVNNAKESPLHLSSLHGHGKVVAALLAKHADARLRNARSETALDVAARLGKANVCRLIICNCPELALQSAADCSTTDGSSSRHISQVSYPLHAAARHGHIDCLQVLCHSGFDLNYVTEEGSALHVAALFGKVDAVKLLLEQGVDVDIRDGQGRTVLETLREHENQKAVDLTQVMQSRDGWLECIKLIEDCIQSRRSCSSGYSRKCNNSFAESAYMNLPHTSKQSDDVVWKPIPDNASARLQALANYPISSIAKWSKAANKQKRCVNHPSSVIGGVVMLSSDENESADISASSLPVKLDDLSEIEQNGQKAGLWSAVKCSNFPQHSLKYKSCDECKQRKVHLLPRMGTRQTTSTATCSCQTPFAYEEWCPVRWKAYDNVDSTPHPPMAYDNIPDNLVIYDNALPAENKRWQRDCEKKPMTNFTVEPRPVACCLHNDGTLTVLPEKPSCQRLPLHKNISKDGHETEELDDGEIYHMKDIYGDKESTRSTPSRASVVTFTCSTFERSCSVNENSDVLVATNTIPRGRAPLALPEEISVSTSASILSIENSPERTIIHEVPVNNSLCINSPSKLNKWELYNSDQKERSHLDRLPSPETAEFRIRQFLCGQDLSKQCTSLSPTVSKRSQHTQKDPLSPSSTVGSDCTLASSCSLPVISTVSSASASFMSPLQETACLFKDKSIDEQSVSSTNVRLCLSSPSSSTNAMKRETPDLRNESVSSIGELHDRNCSAGCRQYLSILNGHFECDEVNEWKKIGELVSSLNGVNCQGLQALSHSESRVAVYLRNRRSQALTLHLGGSWTLSHRVSSTESDESLQRPKGLNVVSDWLNKCVGIPKPRSDEIADILENNGFDRIEHMQITLDRVAMEEIGLDKSTQHQISLYLENCPLSEVPSANSFAYVSDWLYSLSLEDYLEQFINANLTTMPVVFAAESSKNYLKSIGINKLGHQMRILNSLKSTAEDHQKVTIEHLTTTLPDDEADSGQESRSTVQSTSSVAKWRSAIFVEGGVGWHHSTTALIHKCVSYSAHYLGSMEISNVEGTEDSRRAMIKLKNSIPEIAKIAHVILEISVSGLRILDAATKHLTLENAITRIQIIVQDDRDLNFFAYTSRYADRHLCHVFCVLTADVATEIIVTLGQAFEICQCLMSGGYRRNDIAGTAEIA